jgi:Protein of unknown function (DUF2786)
VRETVTGMLTGTVDWETGLDLLTVAPAAEVDTTLVTALREVTAALIRHGWQPVELHRVVGRQGDPVLGRLVTDAVAAHLAPFARKQVDPRWLAQAAELGARVWWSSDPAYLGEAAGRWRTDRIALLDAVLGLLRVLSDLPRIEVLLPSPGTRVATGPARRVDEQLLNRVRALLAKAESTAFPAEAEAYSAKAQELIARHSIDEALAAGPAAEVVPFARRVGVDHPYENEKAALLHAVAKANHGETVWSPELGFTTVFGFDGDIDAIELLYTSLLVQANRAMAQAEPAGGRAGKARLKAFRRSFLVAYGVRIGERLGEAATAAVTAVAELDLLPVLASRQVKVHETVLRIFPNTVRSRSSRVDSLEGWDSGREAADRAALSGRRPISG